MNSIILSLLVIIFNAPLILFILMYNGPLDIISGTIIMVLSIMIFPAYTSALHASRKNYRIISTFVKFYFSQIKSNFKTSVMFTLIMFVLIIDGLFFKNNGYDLTYNIFLGMSMFCVLIILNSGLLLSTFSMSIKNLFLMNIAYMKSLSVSSLVFILIMLIPYRLDILIYVVALGMAIIGQNYMYKSKLETIRENVTDEQIKYL